MQKDGLLVSFNIGVCKNDYSSMSDLPFYTSSLRRGGNATNGSSTQHQDGKLQALPGDTTDKEMKSNEEKNEPDENNNGEFVGDNQSDSSDDDDSALQSAFIENGKKVDWKQMSDLAVTTVNLVFGWKEHV
jgi:hypothetical protein